MRVFIAVLVLIFSFQSWTKADDIRDFQIEGISIGDSLLDYFSEDKIKDSIVKDSYKHKDGKFLKIDIINHPFKFYDVLSAHVKKNDNKYIVYELSGIMDYINNIEECYRNKIEIVKELKEIFPKSKEFDSGRQKHIQDETGKSTYDRLDLELKSGADVTIICYDWSKEIGFLDHLSVGIESKQFSEWLNN